MADTGHWLSLVPPCPQGHAAVGCSITGARPELSVTLPLACANGILLLTSSPSSLVVSKNHTAPLLTCSPQKFYLVILKSGLAACVCLVT